MKRDLKRVYKEHGIKYFAFPAIVLLMLAALADQRLEGYISNREEAADLTTRLETNRNILDLNEKIKRNFDELNPNFASLQQQFFVGQDISDSVNAMQEEVRKLLQSLYFDNVEFSDYSDARQNNVSRIAMSVRFTGVPQQLPRLQKALAQSSKMLAIDNLEINVVEDPQRGGKQLAVKARFAGMHMKPVPDYISASNASKTTDVRQ